MPTLILSGDRDTIVPIRTTREYLRVFPNASFLPVAGAGHTAAAWSECAFDVFHTFVRDLDSPSAQACTEPGYVVAAASAFPELARGVVPAVPAAGDGSTLLQRRVVAAAVLAVRDGWVRSFKDPASVNSFSGLRGGGGTFNYDGWPTNVLDLQASRYVADVSVTGESVFVGDDNSLTFTIEVDGPGQLDGTLTGEGLFGFNQPYGDFQVTGSLNGSPVTVVESRPTDHGTPVTFPLVARPASMATEDSVGTGRLLVQTGFTSLERFAPVRRVQAETGGEPGVGLRSLRRLLLGHQGTDAAPADGDDGGPRPGRRRRPGRLRTRMAVVEPRPRARAPAGVGAHRRLARRRQPLRRASVASRFLPMLARRTDDAQSPAPDERLDVEDALRRLGPERRRALVLHDLCGLTVAEVAAETGVAEGTVKSRLSRSSRGAGGASSAP